MIRSDTYHCKKGFNYFYAQDFVGVDELSEHDELTVSIWPDGHNGSNEPDAIGMVSIQHEAHDGEPMKEFCVLLDKTACLKLRDMLNERFPV